MHSASNGSRQPRRASADDSALGHAALALGLQQQRWCCWRIGAVRCPRAIGRDSGGSIGGVGIGGGGIGAGAASACRGNAMRDARRAAIRSSAPRSASGRSARRPPFRAPSAPTPVSITAHRASFTARSRASLPAAVGSPASATPSIRPSAARRRQPVARRRSGVPPAGERRFVADEVMVRLPSNLTRAGARRACAPAWPHPGRVAPHRADRHDVPSLAHSGRPLRAGHHPRARSRDRRERGAAELSLHAGAAARASARQAGTRSQQYALAKLNVPQAHRLATGDRVLIAVIDSGIDTSHPEIDGFVAGSFDALNSKEPPHPHGTAMAGAIVAHARLTGVAPAARILAIRAFGANEHRRRRHHAHAAARHRLGGRARRARHQHELRRTERSGDRARARRGAQEGHRAGRRRRQCRRQVAAAVPGLRPQRHRGHRDRRRGQAVQARQPRQAHRGRGARRRGSGAGAQRRLPGVDRDLDCRRAGQRRSPRCCSSASPISRPTRCARCCSRPPPISAPRAATTSSAPASPTPSGQSRRSRRTRHATPRPTLGRALISDRSSAIRGCAFDTRAVPPPLEGEGRKPPSPCEAACGVGELSERAPVERSPHPGAQGARRPSPSRGGWAPPAYKHETRVTLRR